MINSFFRHSTIFQKTVCLPVICGWLVLFAISGTAQKTPTVKNVKGFNNWGISALQGSSFWTMRSYLLDGKGNLYEREGAKSTTKKVEETVLEEIVKLLQELNLPGTKTKIVKGTKIYDGPYSTLIITLDDKDYKIEGNSVTDEKQFALTAKQKNTLLKLKEQLTKIGFIFLV